MKTSCILLAGLAVANGFQTAAPVFGRSGNQLTASSIKSRSTCAPMTMLMGPSRRGGLKSSVARFARNLFVPKSKDSRGSKNGGGGNKLPPPTGPLSASAAGDADKKKSSNPLVGIWNAYNGALETQPILTKAMTSLVGFGLGDFLAQKFIDKTDKINWERLLRMASFGALIHGPTGHFFYGFLDSKIPGTAAITVASKVFIDQIIWNPIFGCMFFGYMGAVEGLGPAAIQSRIEKNLWASVKGSWTVWPVAHAINFRFVPTSQRLLYINSIQIGYNMFLSILSQRAAKSSVPEPIKKGAKKSATKTATKTKK